MIECIVGGKLPVSAIVRELNNSLKADGSKLFNIDFIAKDNYDVVPYWQIFRPRYNVETNLSNYIPDFIKYDNFEYVMDADSKLMNPTNFYKFKSGIINIKQDSIGGWRMSFDNNWIFPNGYPGLDTRPDKNNLHRYTVVTEDKILMELITCF